MKLKFSLSDAELSRLQSPGLASTFAHQIWQAVCQRVGCQFATLEDAQTGNPHEFIAEPVVPEPPGDDVLKVATSAENALYDQLCPGRNLAQRGIPDGETSIDASMEKRILRALADSGQMANMKPPLSSAEREVFDKCRNIEKAVAGPFFGDGPFKSGEYRVFRQERLWLPNSGKPGFFAHWGEPHAVFRVGTRALVVQYNLLLGSDTDDLCDHRERLDLIVLVAGHYAPLKQVSTVVIEPHVTESPEVVTYELSAIEDSYKDMVRRIAASNRPGAVRTPGEVQCKSCKAVGKCNENRVWRDGQIIKNKTTEYETAIWKSAEQTPVLEPPVYPPKKSQLARK